MAVEMRVKESATTAAGSRWWTVQRGAGSILATAIHDGNELRGEIDQAMKLTPPDRLREEDPFTGQAIVDVPTHVIVHRSRFEFDLNRAPEERSIETPEQCWAWTSGTRRLTGASAGSLAIHRNITGCLASWLDDFAAGHPRFVLLDVHSYNTP